jgi:hypothetical protein
MSYDKVLGTHDLMVHDYGPGRKFASVHIEMAADNDPFLSHEIIDGIEKDFLSDMNLHLIIHYDPISTNDVLLTELKLYIAEKVKTIREARGYYVANHGSVQAFIPSYSDAKVGAKLFLRFMFSDEMMKLYREYTYVDLPFKYTNEPKADEREFMQAMYEIKSRPNSRSIQCFIYSNLRAQIPTYPKQNTVVATFQGLSYSHQYGTPLYTAKGIYDDNIEYVKTKWTTYLQAAGYSD